MNAPTSRERTRDKFAWLNQVRLDLALPRSCLHIALAISERINNEGEAFPGQELLATETGLTRGGVRNALRALETAGHLHVVSGQGRRIVSRYRCILLPAQKGQSGAPFKDGKRVTAVSLLDAEKGHSIHKKRVTPVATNPIREPIPSTTAEEVASRSAEDELPEAEKIIPLRPAAAAPLDARARLFAEGLPILAKQSGRKPENLRGVLGRWLKLTNDDAKAVLRAIEDARDDGVADPIARIEDRLFGPAKRQPKSSFDPSFMFRRH